ncbi:hypothetical protein [Bacillus wiedmannii]|uniref:hypothetical protein n=1 Tax=Bacillus wiedmannii TaxID=1890302 RepID=UPI000BEF7433|nr:hypothetical protein [Bacillus wiedmannii]PEM30187.1 hypothetical protein CN598_12745 [Bacillus wiedmannii]
MNTPNKVLEAIYVLKQNDFSNREILMNVNNDYFNFEEKLVNESFEVINRHFINFNDKNFDELVRILYGFPNQQ